MECEIVFFLNDPATTEIYTLALHDALPISVIEPVVEARLPPSLAVAVTDRVKLGSSAELAVMVRPASCAGVSVQLPPPLLVPADRVASLGTLPRVVDSVSSSSLAPSASTSAALIESEIGVSSGPLAADTVRLGASACSASEIGRASCRERV